MQLLAEGPEHNLDFGTLAGVPSVEVELSREAPPRGFGREDTIERLNNVRAASPWLADQQDMADGHDRCRFEASESPEFDSVDTHN